MALRGGVDVGGTKIATAVLDGRNRVLGHARGATPTTGGPRDVVAAIAVTLREATTGAGVDPAKLAGVGVGTPGAVDPRRGTVTEARNLPGWAGTFPLRRELSRKVGVPVFLGNDVSVGVEAEFALGAGKPYRSILGVFWGTGVGAGIVLDGKLWTGRGAAGEIGHTVVKIGGARCPCGRRGCLEAYAGRGAMEARARRLVDRGEKTVLFKIMRKSERPRLTSGVFAKALEADDPMAHALLDRAVEALGAGIASAVNLLDVEAVVIGGGLGTRLGDPYAKRIETAMMPHLFVDERPPAVHVAALGDLGGAIGAARLVQPPTRPARSRARSAPSA
jgi:glucokinase